MYSTHNDILRLEPGNRRKKGHPLEIEKLLASSQNQRSETFWRIRTFAQFQCNASGYIGLLLQVENAHLIEIQNDLEFGRWDHLEAWREFDEKNHFKKQERLSHKPKFKPHLYSRPDRSWNRAATACKRTVAQAVRPLWAGRKPPWRSDSNSTQSSTAGARLSRTEIDLAAKWTRCSTIRWAPAFCTIFTFHLFEN